MSDLTVTEDNEIIAVAALRASNPGMKRDAIAQRLGIHPARVGKILGLPAVRAAVLEAQTAAEDGAILVLADHAEESAETIAAIATVGPDDVARDALKLKAALGLLGELRASRERAQPQGNTYVQAQSVTIEQRTEAYDLYVDLVRKRNGHDQGR